MLSLLAEDLMPKPGDHFSWSWLRLVVALAALVLLVVAVRFRFQVRQESGTLVSVRALKEGQRDRAGESRELAVRLAMSIRTVHRWFDPHGQAVGGVVDVSDLCSGIGAQTELLINTATDNDTFTVAPNLPWPMGMALGGYLPAEEFPVRLAELPAEGVRKGKTEYFLLTSLPKGHACAEAEPERLDESTGDRVGIWIGLTKNAGARDDAPWREWGVSTRYTIGPSPEIPEDENPHYDGEQLRTLAYKVAAELVRIKRLHRDRELVVFATMPKAVATAVGWLVVQSGCRFYPGTYLMDYYGPDKRYMPMRVRHSQPRTVTFSAAPAQTSN